MKRATRLLNIAAAVVAAAAVGLGLPAAASATPLASTAPPPPPGAGPVPAVGQLTIIDANVAEYLNAKDNLQRQDLSNFAHRAKLVLDAQQAADVPVQTPDLVFLQEVDASTARAVAIRLSHVFSASYVVAGTRETGPARGDGAVVLHRSARHALFTRATAVLYNTATMDAPGAAPLITFSYPKRQMWTKRQCAASTIACTADLWESRQSALFEFTAKATGRQYAVASVHFVPAAFLRPQLTAAQQPGFREAQWINQLQTAITAAYPDATQILAGDYNTRLCDAAGALPGQQECDQADQYTPMLRAALSRPGYQVLIDSGIDHVFTTAAAVASGKDTTYKRYGTTAHGRVRTAAEYLDDADFASRFSDGAAFNRCNAAYNAGRASPAFADAIAGCRHRYYSDHRLDWAVLD
ncbi:MAG TPA: endonuclease/exonuclease/phosphatase family protein [Jatrophihabitantaceae bacterium]|nr:endonuclease/exonuclease/phosphatase family protein [Jatrophihabitantaceae bacterium]